MEDTTQQCRFAGTAGHRCGDPYGRPLRAGELCFGEARARLMDQAEPSHADVAAFYNLAFEREDAESPS